MTLILGRLNQLTEGKGGEDDTKKIMQKTAREPSMAPVFNHASMAHNNHLFFDRLAPGPVEMPRPLRRDLEESFGSTETLRRELAVTATAMFGPGFVWLVKAALPYTGRPAGYRILTTYLAGSPYPEAHWRRQGVDMNTVGGASPDAQAPGHRWLEDQTRALKEEGRPPGGVKVVPLLCVNTWEHVWLEDYGVMGPDGVSGKKTFAERWWDAIDWHKVAHAANIRAPPKYVL